MLSSSFSLWSDGGWGIILHITVVYVFFFLQGGSPLADDKLQECFKVAVKRAKEVRDLVQTACINVDRWYNILQYLAIKKYSLHT